MKQSISTLMDGELCGEEAEALLGKIKSNPEARNDWLNYHLIGDVLRQPDYISNDINPSFFERLQAEPTVLAPRNKRSSKIGYFAMSAAAAIMAMAFVAWVSVQIDTKPLIQQAQQQLGTVHASSFPANASINDYLLAHHEFSPSTDVRGAASYIRTVAARPAVAGQ